MGTDDAATDDAATDDAATDDAATDAAADTATQGDAGCTLELKEQISSSACTEGTSYGCTSATEMWVDKGCRANFELGGTALHCGSLGLAYKGCTISGEAGVGSDLATEVFVSGNSGFQPQAMVVIALLTGCAAGYLFGTRNQ